MKGYRVSKAKGKKIIYIYPNITETEINLVKTFYVPDGYELVAKTATTKKSDVADIKKCHILGWLAENDKVNYEVWKKEFIRNNKKTGKRDSYLAVKKDFMKKYDAELDEKGEPIDGCERKKYKDFLKAMNTEREKYNVKLDKDGNIIK